ncbi:GntR family transcriptional regulator [Leucobacter iarius]|uniref:HTH gntR-type domain-containing protein n=1 Tax=Leucobacter iarius TaxID=333963 RepID=A0ABN2L7K6_9MICO
MPPVPALGSTGTPAHDGTRLDLRVDLLSDQVYDRLIRDIVLERYTPGQRLKLDEIAAELGISRTPVREAVRRLADEGFITIARNSRTEVAHWGDTDMQERVRALGLLVAGAIDHADTAQLNRSIPGASCREHRPSGDCEHRDPFAGLARFLEVSAALLPVGYPTGAEGFSRGVLGPLGTYLTHVTLTGRGHAPAVRAAGLEWCAVERELLRGNGAALRDYAERVHRSFRSGGSARRAVA